LVTTCGRDAIASGYCFDLRSYNVYWIVLDLKVIRYRSKWNLRGEGMLAHQEPKQMSASLARPGSIGCPRGENISSPNPEYNNQDQE